MTWAERQQQEALAAEDLGVVLKYKDVGLGLEFAKLVMEQFELNGLKKQAEDKLKIINEKLMEMIGSNDQIMGCEKHCVMVDTFKAHLIDSSNSHIDGKRLLELGVDAVIISRATVTKPYSYIRVTDTEKKQVREQEKAAGAVSIASHEKHPLAKKSVKGKGKKGKR